MTTRPIGKQDDPLDYLPRIDLEQILRRVVKELDTEEDETDGWKVVEAIVDILHEYEIKVNW